MAESPPEKHSPADPAVLAGAREAMEYLAFFGSLIPASFLRPDAGEPNSQAMLSLGRGERRCEGGAKATFKAEPVS